MKNLTVANFENFWFSAQRTCPKIYKNIFTRSRGIGKEGGRVEGWFSIGVGLGPRAVPSPVSFSTSGIRLQPKHTRENIYPRSRK